jgi:hypothetical protein
VEDPAGLPVEHAPCTAPGWSNGGARGRCGCGCPCAAGRPPRRARRARTLRPRQRRRRPRRGDGTPHPKSPTGRRSATRVPGARRGPPRAAPRRLPAAGRSGPGPRRLPPPPRSRRS